MDYKDNRYKFLGNFLEVPSILFFSCFEKSRVHMSNAIEIEGFFPSV